VRPCLQFYSIQSLPVARRERFISFVDIKDSGSLVLVFGILVTSLCQIFKDASSKIRGSWYVFFLAELIYSLNFVSSEPEIDELIPHHDYDIDLRRINNHRFV